MNSETSAPALQQKPAEPSVANPLDLGPFEAEATLPPNPDAYDNWLSDMPLTGGYCVPGDDGCEACQ